MISPVHGLKRIRECIEGAIVVSDCIRRVSRVYLQQLTCRISQAAACHMQGDTGQLKVWRLLRPEDWPTRHAQLEEPQLLQGAWC